MLLWFINWLLGISECVAGWLTYTAEDLGSQVLVELADDDSDVVILDKCNQNKNKWCEWKLVVCLFFIHLDDSHSNVVYTHTVYP